MFEYFKRKFSKPKTFKVNTYPKYYEESGLIIREDKDGTRHVVTVDDKGNEITLKRLS